MTMDDLELVRDLGRELEHEPPASLARQRGRLLHASRQRGRGGRVRWPLLGAVAAVTAAAILLPMLTLHDRHQKPAADTTPPAPAGPLNVLVIGSDARRDGYPPRADTLMLVHVPADRKNVQVVSIPRDLLVTLPGCANPGGKDAPARPGLINSAFTRGGAACTLRTVESLTRVRIDQTAVLGFDGFRRMVDALGGVEMTLPAPVADPAARLRLSAGTQTLDGRQALAYVRARRGLGDGSDRGRIERQQMFMAALVRRMKALQSDNPLLFGRFLAAAAVSVETVPRLNVGTLKALADTFAGTGAGDVEFRTAPVRPAPADPNRLAWDAEAAERLFAPFRE
ncbi:LCP family protein [Actinomadura sp. 6K520]|uniref:LCP family protein n=1 Tax=Actinomadura sp. 6K520 TaxID=2530364 RepID=UPI001046920E|nr:LCP family protein [Actinomadura sp. 6K520]TDE35512.1 LytR family transcriptional regulator [Actinomadura sp. 6K520]